MAELAFYIEALGLAEHEDGSPAYGCISINLGEYKPGKEVSYDELIKDKDPAVILSKMVSMSGLHSLALWLEKLSEIRFITPEEYAQKYNYKDFEDE